MSPKNWRDENCSNKQRDIENDVIRWLNIVYIVIDDETFQQTFVNKTIKDSLKVNIHAYLDTW